MKILHYLQKNFARLPNRYLENMFVVVIGMIRPFWLFLLLLILTLFVSRIGLGIWQIDRFEDIKSFWTLIINGLRIDLVVVGYLLFLPAVIHPWVMLFSKTPDWWIKLLRVVFFTIFICVLFFELVTPTFISEYGFRPNRLFIEYLSYPNEVIKMLVNGHLLTSVVVISLVTLPCKLYWNVLGKLLDGARIRNSVTIASSTFSFIVLFLTLFLCARGTTGHRPINPAFVYFSTDPLVNSLTLNSFYSVVDAYRKFGKEKNSTKIYGEMKFEKIVEIVQRETGLPAHAFKFSKNPFMVSRFPVYQGQPKNLVIILEESMGAQFVSSLGGLRLTPEIDSLNSQGWAFNQLYATGTRSVRGIEAIITGFTPTPARAVVKLDKSQHGFFTIASLLKANGYTTQFIYGGESHFDNMKSFFLGNGFTDIVDFDDIKDPGFVASWGASDEDLFNQADTELNKLSYSNKPFFSLIFTSSNHDPFEIPSGKIVPIDYTQEQLDEYDEKELLRHNAIQYADYALGKFIRRAKTQPYWKDTVFLIVADHDARTSGSALVPVKNFHIPGVILNSGKEHFIDKRVVSQIDLPPTLLSLIGIENVSPMLGYDLNIKEGSGRAMMQYSDNFAYMKDHNVIILQSGKKAFSFYYDSQNKTLVPQKINSTLAEVALAHALWGSLAYEKGWYRFEKK